MAAVGLDFVAGGGAMGALIRAKDWSQTPLGPIDEWPLSLKMMVGFLLSNRFPMLLWWGPDYVGIYNDGYAPVLGAKHPWALGLPTREVWSEIWDVLKPLIDTPFRGGPSTWIEDFELELNRHGYLEETHFTVAYSPVPDVEARSIGGVLATVHEITEKIIGERRLAALRDLGARAGEAKTAEEACARAAAALAHHPKDVPFALVYLVDADGVGATLAGCAGVEAGADAAPLHVSLARDPVWPLGDVLRTGSTVVLKDLATRVAPVPEGPWRDAPSTAVVVPLHSALAGEMAGFLVAGVSARRMLDEQYQSFFDLTAAQIATAVANARALEAERRRAEALAEIDRAKTVFFSNVSHEFRTPLTLILNPIGEVIEKASEESMAAMGPLLRLAQRNGLRLQRLVNTLLDFSRIEAGRAETMLEPVDLAAATADLASNFRSAIESAGVAFTVNCPPLPAPVYVDRDMWEKVVLNLVSNAFKYTLSGSIDVSLRKDGDRVVLKVRDTGIGIPPEALSRVFERFYRVPDSRGRTVEGTGIGLALVQELTKLLGGSVTVESTVDQGSTFTVSVPLQEASRHTVARESRMRTLQSTAIGARAFIDEAAGWVREAEKAPGAAAMGASGRARVLVADDNADMRGYVHRLLSESFDVVSVGDGTAALQAMRATPPDLLLADVMMPGLDGFQLLKAVLADPDLRHIPVMLLSARAGEEARAEGVEAGAADYVTKPFAPRELLARIQKQVDSARVRDHETRSAQVMISELTAESGMLRKLFQQAPGVLAVMRGPEHVFEMINPAYQETIGGRDVVGKPVREALPEFAGQGIFDLLDEVYRTGEPFVGRDYRVMLISKRGGEPEERFFDFVYQPVREADGTVSGILVEGTDATDRVQAQKRHRLVMDELSHRVKNTLATVQSIATQTLRNAGSMTEAKSLIENRILSLARTQEVLTRGNWEGADLRDILSQELDPYGLERATLLGPQVRLSPRIAAALAMVFHELATNAAKYGALSAERGRLEVRWQLQHKGTPGERVEIDWRESGGPSVQAPTRRGFGSRLIERTLTADIGASVDIRYPTEGLLCRMSLPTHVASSGN